MRQNGNTPRPPGWARTLLAVLIPWRYRDEHLGDLQEGFLKRAETNLSEARGWYRRQVLRSIPAAIRLRYQTRNGDTSTHGSSMETIGQDLKYGLRALWRTPGFAIVSTLTLAIAIGVNTSIFSLVSAIVFADLPMQDSETVALIRGTNPELGIDQGSVSPADYMDLVERSRSYESLSALTEAQWVLTGGDAPLRVQGLQFTAGLTETWRLPPVLGRSFAEGEDRWGAPRVTMLTHGFWQDRYSGRTDILGEVIRLDGMEHTIIGVASPKLEFASFAQAQVITPLILNRSEPNRSARYLFVAGRLAPGVTQEAATQEVRQISEQLAREYPVDNTGWAMWSAPVMESLIDQDGNTLLLLLQLTVGMVILIACANVANMLLARSTARAREFAVRSALGAGRGRLIRQLLTESLMISIAAAALGLAFAVALNKVLIWISAGTEVAFLMVRFDERVLGFTLLVSLVAPLVFGLMPAVRASAAGPQAALRDGRSGDGGRSGKRARGALVTAQISLALTLMIVASLLTRTVVNLQTRPLGFDAGGLLTLYVDLPDDLYEDAEAQRIFFAQAREALTGPTASPQVELASVIPAAGSGARRSFVVEGREVIEGRAPPTGLVVRVSNGYFDMVGLPVEAGRAFTESDGPESFHVAVVSRSLADRYWPDEDPVGRRLRISGEEAWVQVVGVVGDVRSMSDSDQGEPNLYRPFSQDTRSEMYLVARTQTDAGTLGGPIREAIWGIDPNQPVDAIRTMERAQYETEASRFALLTLFVTFAVFALLMAAIGIYGVMAYSVSQRRNEIGLRMALGAEGGAVRWMILSQGARMLALGIAIGVLAALALSRLLGNLVFGISAVDPLTFIGVPALLGVVALVANLVPARRATKLDPATTLRAD
jgi:putative ABC transport system permease protein